MICPLCNGMTNENYTCKKCTHEMTNCGRISDIYDDYSAYVQYNLDEEMRSTCTHSFYCSSCDTYENIEIDLK